MPYTKRQQKAACVAYGIKKKGGTPDVMGDMPQSKLRQWCKAKKLEKKEESVTPMFKSQQLQEIAPAIGAALGGAARAAAPLAKGAAKAVATKAPAMAKAAASKVGPMAKQLGQKAAPHLKAAGKQALQTGAQDLTRHATDKLKAGMDKLMPGEEEPMESFKSSKLKKSLQETTALARRLDEALGSL